MASRRSVVFPMVHVLLLFQVLSPMTFHAWLFDSSASAISPQSSRRLADFPRDCYGESDILSLLEAAVEMNNSDHIVCDSAGLSSSFPLSIGDFTDLQHLAIYAQKSIFGTYPTTLGKLVNLTHLDLSKNTNMNAPIPTQLYALTQLTHLNLGAAVSPSAQISNGIFPPEVSNLKKLEFLNICCLRFQGTLTENLFELSALTHLELQQFTAIGPLPSLFHKLTNLEKLVASVPFLSGTERTYLQIDKLSKLKHLDLAHSAFDMSFLSDIRFASKLTYLDISYFTYNFASDQTIPSDLFELTDLEDLNIYDRAMKGKLPENLTQTLNKLTSLELQFNSFSGKITESLLSNMPNLEFLNLGNNKFEGSLPEALYGLTKLTYLSLRTNGFRGTLSPKIGNLTNLQHLLIQDIFLTSELPSTLSLLTKLTSFFIKPHSFTGTVPFHFATSRDAVIGEILFPRTAFPTPSPMYPTPYPIFPTFNTDKSSSGFEAIDLLPMLPVFIFLFSLIPYIISLVVEKIKKSRGNASNVLTPRREPQQPTLHETIVQTPHVNNAIRDELQVARRVNESELVLKEEKLPVAEIVESSRNLKPSYFDIIKKKFL